MTHDELVSRAILWLKNYCHCSVIISELSAYTRSCEIPDAIGWVNNRAILVECKTSLSDFYAEKRKKARYPGYPALGAWRFYLTGPGILKSIPDGWGLYEVTNRRVRYAMGTEYRNAAVPPFESSRESEVALLLSCARRLKKSGGFTYEGRNQKSQKKNPKING